MKVIKKSKTITVEFTFDEIYTFTTILCNVSARLTNLQPAIDALDKIRKTFVEIRVDMIKNANI